MQLCQITRTWLAVKNKNMAAGKLMNYRHLLFRLILFGRSLHWHLRFLRRFGAFHSLSGSASAPVLPWALPRGVGSGGWAGVGF